MPLEGGFCLLVCFWRKNRLPYLSPLSSLHYTGKVDSINFRNLRTTGHRDTEGFWESIRNIVLTASDLLLPIPQVPSTYPLPLHAKPGVPKMLLQVQPYILCRNSKGVCRDFSSHFSSASKTQNKWRKLPSGKARVKPHLKDSRAPGIHRFPETTVRIRKGISARWS